LLTGKNEWLEIYYLISQYKQRKNYFNLLLLKLQFRKRSAAELVS
jgi:hypothetical protein